MYNYLTCMMGTSLILVLSVTARSQSPIPARDVRPDGPLVQQPRAPGNVAEELPHALQAPTVAPSMLPDQQQLHQAVVAAGEAAFNRGCIQCHDAEKSLARSKSFSDWLATVRRMAAKDGADVPPESMESIAAFLASRGPPVAIEPGVSNFVVGGAPNLAFYGTLSPLWLGGSDNLQNPGFFPDVWLGANWQTNSPLSARATACVSCHTEPGSASRIELVEAALRFDLAKAAGCCGPLRASLDAGRFVVPFGAFSSQSNPGVYRTVTMPLIYNMGQRVRSGDFDPVLPMPFSDEGASLAFGAPLMGEVIVSLDTYVINGLQGTADGVDFDLSRDYVDNNSRPSAGGRLYLGNNLLRLGSSIVGGQFSPSGGSGPANEDLYYQVYGWDATFRYQDVFRVQCEYARRDSDRIGESFADMGPLRLRDKVDGYYIESELLVSRRYLISLLARYDWQQQSLTQAPEGFSVAASAGVTRWTFGLNVNLVGGSLLMLNYEHWTLPGDLARTDVVGARWACTF